MPSDKSELIVRCGVLAERLRCTRHKLKVVENLARSLHNERTMLWRSLREIIGADSSATLDRMAYELAAQPIDAPDRDSLDMMLRAIAVLKATAPPAWRGDSGS